MIRIKLMNDKKPLDLEEDTEVGSNGLTQAECEKFGITYDGKESKKLQRTAKDVVFIDGFVNPLQVVALESLPKHDNDYKLGARTNVVTTVYSFLSNEEEDVIARKVANCLFTSSDGI